MCVSAGLKWVLMSKLTPMMLNLSPLKIVVSKKIASETDISAVNLIFGLCLFACSMNWLTTYLLVYMREIMPWM